ncbi:MAG: hypothetical protein HZB56_16595, partial [Deltaproteobacteria bacterium]|nr:hypothetical protein [Deltaproteobacteria bacterium]
MQFQCDRCGKRYSTGQEIREGRAYRFKCRACGHDVIVRGPQGLTDGGATPTPVLRRSSNGNGVQAGGLAQPTPRPLAETPPPTVSVVNPGDAGPPPGGYLEFRLDNDVVTTQTGITSSLTDPSARELTPLPPSPFLAPISAPQPPAPQQATLYVPPPLLEPSAGDPTPGLSGEARVGETRQPAPRSRRGLVVALVAVVPAVLVILLFGGLWESSGGSKAGGTARPAAPKQTPGLLTPQVYVGPVTFEAPTPQLEPSAAAPARPARPAAAPPRPAPAPARREVASSRKPAPARAAATGRQAEAPAQEPEPEPPTPEPQVAQAAPPEPAPAPAAAP